MNHRSLAARLQELVDGRAVSDDGLLDVKLAPPKELGGMGGATNPEQLFAAGYSVQKQGLTRIETF